MYASCLFTKKTYKLFKQTAMKTTQDIINEAAEKQANAGTPFHVRKDAFHWMFEQGATFALSTPELWREGYLNWANWLRDNTVADGAPKVIYKPTMERKTTDELFDLYIQHLKTQQ